MSELIAWVLIFAYIGLEKPELIISAGLFGVAAEINSIWRHK